MNRKERRKLSHGLRKEQALAGKKVKQQKVANLSKFATKQVEKRSNLGAMLSDKLTATDARLEQKRIRTVNYGSSQNCKGFYNGNLAKGRKSVKRINPENYQFNK